MKRFFASVRTKNMLILSKSESHHVKNVMRMKAGELITVIFEKTEFICELTSWSNNQYFANIIKPLATPIERLPKISCLLALQKAHSLRNTLHKLSELGVNQIFIFTSSRSIPRLTTEIIAQKIDRWKLIINTAIKQSQQSVSPSVHYLSQVADFLALNCENTIKILCNETLTQINTKEIITKIKLELKASKKEIYYIIGPEGGFTTREIAMFQEYNCVPWKFAPTTLRCDTAAIIALSLLSSITHKWS